MEETKMPLVNAGDPVQYSWRGWNAMGMVSYKLFQGVWTGWYQWKVFVICYRSWGCVCYGGVL